MCPFLYLDREVQRLNTRVNHWETGAVSAYFSSSMIHLVASPSFDSLPLLCSGSMKQWTGRSVLWHQMLPRQFDLGDVFDFVIFWEPLATPIALLGIFTTFHSSLFLFFSFSTSHAICWSYFFFMLILQHIHGWRWRKNWLDNLMADVRSWALLSLFSFLLGSFLFFYWGSLIHTLMTLG